MSCLQFYSKYIHKVFAQLLYPKNATYIIINTEVYSSSFSIWALYVSRIRDIQVKFGATADKLDRVLCSINIQSNQLYIVHINAT